jgi:uncharacterized protein (TIGR03905 family)
MKYSYKTSGTCSVRIDFDLDGDVVRNIKFEKGCDGNLQAVARFAEGMAVGDIERNCKGILCGKRGTSCADQLALAVRKALTQTQSDNPDANGG